jgi:hypothetical protein
MGSATTIPSSDATDDQGLTARYGVRWMRVERRRQAGAENARIIFRTTADVSSKDLSPPAYSVKNPVKTPSSAELRVGTGFATACRRGEIESSLSLFSLTDS